MLHVFRSAVCTTIKVQCIDFLVDLFGSLEEFMSRHMREVEEENNMEGERFNEFLFLFRRKFNELMILSLTWH